MKMTVKVSNKIRKCHDCDAEIPAGEPYLLVTGNMSGIFCGQCVHDVSKQIKEFKR